MAASPPQPLVAEALKKVDLFTDGTCLSLYVTETDEKRLNTDPLLGLLIGKKNAKRESFEELLSGPYVINAPPCDASVLSDSPVTEAVDQQKTLDQHDETLDDTSDNSDSLRWSHSATLSLICFVEERKGKFNSPALKKNQIWKEISTAMQNSGEPKSWESCEKKWRNLKARYRCIVDNNKKTGRGKVTWPYFSRMEDVLSSDPATFPLATTSSIPNTDDSRDEADSSVKHPAPKKQKKRSRTPDWVSQFLEKQREENEHRNKELLDFRREFIETQREKNEILKQLITSLSKQ